MFAVGELKHKIMQSFYDVVILWTQPELNSVGVKSVKIVDKDLA